ncbi:MAG: dolichyl-phosphate-mannose-protein mannosyltransferase [Merismopedia sp. SIO2A8]|nr:dolichyl-phosphate-mannose-protein mannosyltransferase [Merismopedia sp. SIO2A8]
MAQIAPNPHPASASSSLWRTTWLKYFLLLVLFMGAFFRFYHIDHKVYWYDETMTSLRISGYTQPQAQELVYGIEHHTIEEFRAQYQYPKNGSTSAEMWVALAQHPEHSPAYYALARSWMQLFPNGVLSIRLLSVLISLLAFPCMYWLVWELFQSPLVSWAAVSILAISPFHVLYAQEAREYSLWTTAILFASAALLWAMRRNRPLHWLGYGVANALALYVHPFSGFVTISHGLYVAIAERCRFNRRTISCLMALLLSMALFAPWLQVVVQQSDLFVGNTASVSQPRSGVLPLFWLLNLSRLFFDLNQGPSAINPVHYWLAGLAIASIIYLCRQTTPKRWGFVLLLMGVTGLAIIGPDVLLGGRRSSITRYAVPSYLGLQISVAFLFANRITVNPFAAPGTFRWPPFWRNTAIALVFAGFLSCAVNAHNPVWWHKSYSKSRRNPDVAAMINQSDRPLVISDKKPLGYILSLTHLLDGDVGLQLIDQPEQTRIPKRFETVFLYLPSENLKQRLENRKNITLEPITFGRSDDPWLWQVLRTE